MEVTILGNNSALPAYGRNPTSQVVSVYGEHLMLDCGEGTQLQMQIHGVRWSKLNHIFISHMHGDHYFGLPGLVNSMSLLGRVAPLHLYGPAGLMPILQAVLDEADSVLCYPLHFTPLPEGAAMLAETENFKVSCFPVEHRIACHGFLVESKNKGRKIIPVACRDYEIPRYYYDRLKQGEDYERKDGTIIKNELLTTEGPATKKYAFCADTLYTESFLPYITGADTIYHESTYLHRDAEKAAARFHSTPIQAAEIALKANAKQLLLGHYSSKYQDLIPFREEARTIFPNTKVTIEGYTYEV